MLAFPRGAFRIQEVSPQQIPAKSHFLREYLNQNIKIMRLRSQKIKLYKDQFGKFIQ